MFQLDREKLEEFKKLIKFAVTGAANTLIDLAVFTVLVQFLSWNTYFSKGISYTAGMLNSYLVNRKWTFRSKARLFGPEMMRFIVTNLCALGISMLLIRFFTVKIGLIPILANLLATGITLILNFLFSRLWVFRS